MFKKATKSQAKLRCAIFGASGSGKTYSALRMAKGLGSKVAFIDTEYYSASKYSDRFEFDVANLTKNNIDSYVNAIQEAAKAHYNIIIIDSLSHAWTELLQEIDKIAKAKYHGNTWSAWSEGTPKQKQLINAILTYPGHVIATMRCKTEWMTEKTEKGKTRPVRVALSPEQGKGIEYEFDLLLELSSEHIANVIKDRTGKFQDKYIEFPDEEFGKELKEWLNEGEQPVIITQEQIGALNKLMSEHEVDFIKFKNYFGIASLHHLPSDKFAIACEMISSKPLKITITTKPETIEAKELTKDEVVENLEEKKKTNTINTLNKLKELQNEAVEK